MGALIHHSLQSIVSISQPIMCKQINIIVDIPTQESKMSEALPSTLMFLVSHYPPFLSIFSNRLITLPQSPFHVSSSSLLHPIFHSCDLQPPSLLARVYKNPPLTQLRLLTFRPRPTQIFFQFQKRIEEDTWGCWLGSSKTNHTNVECCGSSRKIKMAEPMKHGELRLGVFGNMQ